VNQLSNLPKTFRFQILVSFYFYNQQIDSFQYRIKFFKNYTLILLKFPVQLENISFIRINLSYFSYSSFSIQSSKINSDSSLNIKKSSLNLSSIIVLEEVFSTFSFQDYNLQNEQPNQFSSPFLSTNKEGRFKQVLFLNDNYFLCLSTIIK
jgi:hypothetical protein